MLEKRPENRGSRWGWIWVFPKSSALRARTFSMPLAAYVLTTAEVLFKAAIIMGKIVLSCAPLNWFLNVLTNFREPASSMTSPPPKSFPTCWTKKSMTGTPGLTSLTPPSLLSFLTATAVRSKTAASFSCHDFPIILLTCPMTTFVTLSSQPRHIPLSRSTPHLLRLSPSPPSMSLRMNSSGSSSNISTSASLMATFGMTTLLMMSSRAFSKILALIDLLMRAVRNLRLVQHNSSRPGVGLISNSNFQIVSVKFPRNGAKHSSSFPAYRFRFSMTAFFTFSSSLASSSSSPLVANSSQPLNSFIQCCTLSSKNSGKSSQFKLKNILQTSLMHLRISSLLWSITESKLLASCSKGACSNSRVYFRSM
mmetsp:Transcript_4904/g.9064  ORF Transcript_4904/g.9064 Transcript_4904/m.9064 type:complete len:366 (+) Transcript_4904:1335-2432(+)